MNMKEEKRESENARREIKIQNKMSKKINIRTYKK